MTDCSREAWLPQFSLSTVHRSWLAPCTTSAAGLLSLSAPCFVPPLQSFVGSISYPIIIVISALTLSYTAVGGLSVSIITDQVQGGLAVTLVAVLALYVAITFRATLPSDLGPSRDFLGVNEYGYSSILAMPVSLISATIFSEAMWQRVWASKDKKTLYKAAALGGSGVVVVVFFFSLCGYLAVWGNKVDFATVDYNLMMFQVLNDERDSGSATVSSWVGVLVLILAVTMNESAIDSLQNGLAASISAHFFKNKSIWWARGAVVVMNVPLIVLGTQVRGLLACLLVCMRDAPGGCRRTEPAFGRVTSRFV